MASSVIYTPADVAVPQTTAAALFGTTKPAKQFVCVTAKASNTAEVRVGGSNATTAIGVALLAGQSAKFIIDDAKKLWIVSAAASQVVQVAIDAEPSSGGGTASAAQLPASLGSKADAASLPVTQSTEDKAVLAAMSAKLPSAVGPKTKALSLSIAMATDSLMLPPGSHTAITPSDSTDVTALANIGLLCTVGGTLAVRGATTTGTTVSFPVVAGQYVFGQFSRVMAATTATVFGLAP